MKKELALRWFFYIAGLLILALGITLNTKTGLGVSPIISVAYSVSTIFTLNFGNMTLALYALFVLIEMVLHILRFYRLRVGGVSVFPLRSVLIKDVLQLPLSLFFTRFLNVFAVMIPDMAGTSPKQLFWRFFFLIIAIILTGIGASMSLNMRIIPNPGDGIVQAIADTTKKSVGLMKNCLDICCVATTAVVGLLCAGQVIGIGIGTILAMIGVGRSMAAFHYFLGKKLVLLAGGQVSA